MKKGKAGNRQHRKAVCRHMLHPHMSMKLKYYHKKHVSWQSKNGDFYGDGRFIGENR